MRYRKHPTRVEIVKVPSDVAIPLPPRPDSTQVTRLYDAMRNSVASAKESLEEAGEAADQVRRRARRKDSKDRLRALSSRPPAPKVDDGSEDNEGH